MNATPDTVLRRLCQRVVWTAALGYVALATYGCANEELTDDEIFVELANAKCELLIICERIPDDTDCAQANDGRKACQPANRLAWEECQQALDIALATPVCDDRANAVLLDDCDRVFPCSGGTN